MNWKEEDNMYEIMQELEDLKSENTRLKSEIDTKVREANDLREINLYTKSELEEAVRDALIQGYDGALSILMARVDPIVTIREKIKELRNG